MEKNQNHQAVILLTIVLMKLKTNWERTDAQVLVIVMEKEHALKLNIVKELQDQNHQQDQLMQESNGLVVM